MLPLVHNQRRIVSLVWFRKGSTFGQRYRSLPQNFIKYCLLNTPRQRHTLFTAIRQFWNCHPTTGLPPHPSPWYQLQWKLFFWTFPMFRVNSGIFQISSLSLSSILHFTLPPWTLPANSILAFGLTTQRTRSLKTYIYLLLLSWPCWNHQLHVLLHYSGIKQLWTSLSVPNTS